MSEKSIATKRKFILDISDSASKPKVKKMLCLMPCDTKAIESSSKEGNTKPTNVVATNVSSHLGDKTKVKGTKISEKIQRKLIDISDNTTKSKVKKMSCPQNKTAKSKVLEKTTTGSSKSQIPKAAPHSTTTSHTKRKKDANRTSGNPRLSSNAATTDKKTPYAVRKVTSVNEFLTCKQKKNIMFVS